MAQIDDDLMTWDDVRGLKNWSGIFIGNGASVAVWQNFNYGSLFNQAKNLNDEDKRLSNEDLLLFEEQDTHNFEQVLGDLATARNVCRILGKPHDEIDARYRSIQVALFEAVKSIHVSWEECESAGVLTKLGNLKGRRIASGKQGVLPVLACSHGSRLCFQSSSDFFCLL